MSNTEPFPELTPVHTSSEYPDTVTEVRVRRKKGSSLPEDPRGDTAVGALGSAYDQSSANTLNFKSGSEKYARKSKKSKVRSLFKRWKTFSFKYTWANPLIFCSIIALIYACNPSTENPVYPLIFVSYPLPPAAGAGPDDAVQYGKGVKDFAFVAFYTVFLTFTREFTMQVILRPLAIKGGIKSKGKQWRFMEQAYTAIYFSVYGPYGLYVMKRSNVWFFDTTAFYSDFPHLSHDALFKAYYLLQASYWAQQMIVLLLLLEKPRKDFKELVAHHIITLSLIYLSYAFHFTKIGLAVYITHDVSDFFLATSKVINYLGSPLVIPYFIFFIGTWVYLRHFQNLRFIFSMLPLASPFPDHITELWRGTLDYWYRSFYTGFEPILIKPFGIMFPSTASSIVLAKDFMYNWWNNPSQFESVGSFTLNWDTQQYKCWISQWITFSLLAALQAVNIFWLYFIIRILYRAVVSLGEEAVDERSVDDSDEEVEDEGLEKPIFVDNGKSSAELLAEKLSNGITAKHE